MNHPCATPREPAMKVAQQPGLAVVSKTAGARRAFCFSRGESQPLPGFDEAQYVAAAPYDTTSVASLLAELELLRNANLAAFRRFDADAPLPAPERGQRARFGVYFYSEPKDAP